MKYRKLKSYKYELMEREAICVPELAALTVRNHPYISLNRGMLVIEPRYLWNGSSGWGTVDTDSTFIPTLAHDAIYQLISLGFVPRDYRDEADAILKRLMGGKSKFSRIRAGYYYWFVRRLGGPATRTKLQEKQDIIYTII